MILHRLRHLLFRYARTRRSRYRRQQWQSEILECRQLLAITGLHATLSKSDSSQHVGATLTWYDPDNGSESRYEIRLDQNISPLAVNPKAHYAGEFRSEGPNLTYVLAQDLSPGRYTVYLRRHDNLSSTGWAQHSFGIDDDGDAATPVVSAGPPLRASISVIRQGQGAAGQEISESAIRWQGDSTLFDVWLGQRSPAGEVAEYSVIRNVPAQSITFRKLALAAHRSGVVYFGDIANDATLAQLETGDYQIFVRALNGAADSSGRWIGRGPWSRGVDFSFVRVEGAAAVPDNLRVTHAVRPTISWDPVPFAEAYLVSLWKGPDYQNHPPINLRVHGTAFTPISPEFRRNGRVVPIEPGDEIFVRVRAISSEGMLEGLRRGNYASAVISVPDKLSSADLTAPRIEGPQRMAGDSRPVLRWKPSLHAANYDIWFTSLQTRTRVFLATGMTDNVFHLNPVTLAAHSDFPAGSLAEFAASDGLADGGYRFWVRAQNPASSEPGPWSRSYDFVIDSGRVAVQNFNPADHPESLPLVSPNLVESYSENGQPYLLVTNGLGESFGASVLARFILDGDGVPSRPVVADPVTGVDELRFPDLPMGSNVADMAFLDERRLVVLSRGSNELRLIDVVDWKVISKYALLPGAGGEPPDAMDMEILANGQILVVFNRSSRLRVLEVNERSELSEVSVPGATDSDQGIVLDEGRAMQVSAAARPDGTYAVFLATPAASGVVIRSWDRTSGILTAAVNADGSPVSPVKRSGSSAPFIGGCIKSLPSSNGGRATFYLSTDRNGFLTWIEAETLQFGFVDLIDYVPNASREPSSVDYRNPDDNHVDPSRILEIDDRHIVILNNRVQSVLLKLAFSPDGHLVVEKSTALESGYGADLVSTATGVRLISTSGGSAGRTVTSRFLVITELSYEPLSGDWSAGELLTTEPAASPGSGVAVSDDTVLIEFSDSRSIIHFDRSTAMLVRTDLPQTFLNSGGTTFDDEGGTAAAWHNAETEQDFIAIHASSSDGSGREQDHVLLVLDVTNPEAPGVHSAHSVAADLRWYSIMMDEEQIVVLDRLGAEMVTLFDWQNRESSLHHQLGFRQRQGQTFGGSRTGRVVVLADGTRVVMSDTTPDKVFTVFEPGSLSAEAPVVRVHTNTAGQWIYDMQVFDEDRVLVVTWDARLAILNIRTGVFETIQPLDGLSDSALRLYGTRGIAFEGETLSVGSPAFGTVAEFKITANTSAIGHTATLTRVVAAPDLITTLLTPSARWVVESGRVTRLARH